MNQSQAHHQLVQGGQAPPQTDPYLDEMSLYTEGTDYIVQGDSLVNRRGIAPAIVSPRRPFF